MILCLLMAGWGMAEVAHANDRHEVIVTNSVCIRPGCKWEPKFWFGNLDDPAPPPDYRPNDGDRLRKWYWRNSMHNFDFYVIGLADKTFRRSGRYPGDVFNPQPGWNWAMCKYKWIRLPFISYHRRHFQFYLGWRERGNFGVKLTFDKDL
jgi:hypothetical protein